MKRFEDRSTNIAIGLLAAILIVSPLWFMFAGVGYFTSGMSKAYAQEASSVEREEGINNRENGNEDSGTTSDVQITKPPSDLTIQWWKWIMSIPEEENPVTDRTGEDCSKGDMDDIFFLAGTLGGRAKRECTISEGQAILIPISAGSCVKETFDETQASLNALCGSFFDQAKSLTLIIDGQQIEIGNLQDYRVKVSSFFTVDAVQGNIFGLEADSYQAVSDGYWVLIEEGLSAGEHIIEFVGKMHGFKTSVTYELTVV